MKEFPWNKISFFCFENNLQRFDFLKSKVQDFSKQANFELLKDSLQIFTREKITSKYLSIEFVNQGIPSFHFQCNTFRELMQNCLLEDKDKILYSDEAMIFYLAETISKSKKRESSSAIHSLSKKIFLKWQESIFSQRKINLKPEFLDILDSFIQVKNKKNIFSRAEIIQNQILKNQFVPVETLNSQLGEEVFLYGINDLDRLNFQFIKNLSEKVKINFLINSPKIENIFHEYSKRKICDSLPNNHILNLFFPDHSVSDFLNETNDKPEIIFLECQEIYRELDFVGRDILRKINESNSSKFSLNKIKLIVPDDLKYHSIVAQVFQRMDIPFASTRNIQVKLSPFFIAVNSLLKLSISNFNKEESFSLFYNPCFVPNLGEGRMNLIDPDIWNSIISKLNLSEFLDSRHRKDVGFRGTDILTWETLWKKLSLREVDSNDFDIHFDSDQTEQIDYFTTISSSLFYDLIGFKEDFSDLRDYSNFFKTILEIYLSPITRVGLENFINEKAKRNIDSILDNFISVSDELKKIGIQKKFSLDEFVRLMQEKLNGLITGDSKLLESGVVVGTFVDTIDPSFDFIYAVGLEDKRFSSGIKSDSVEETSDMSLDYSLKNKYDFYNILSQNATKVHLSYINLDSVKDRVYYPYSEYTELRKLRKAKTVNISLRQSDEFEGIYSFENEVYDLVQFQIYLKENKSIQLKSPVWVKPESIETLKTEMGSIDRFPFHEKIIKYLYRQEESRLEQPGRKELSSKQLSAFLECPKKYLYHSKLFLTEEDEEMGEVTELSSIGWRRFVELALTKIIESDTLNSRAIIEEFFSIQNIQEGHLPIGLLNQVEKDKLTLQLDARIIPFFQDLKSEGYTFFPKPIFDSKLKPVPNKPYFSSLLSNDDISHKINIDFWMQKGNKVYFTTLTTSKNKKSHIFKKINSAFSVHLAEEFARKEIEEFFPLKKDIEFLPNILVINQESKLENICFPYDRERSRNFFEDSLKVFREDFFPPTPFCLEKEICQYCKVKSSCFGFQKSFYSFSLVEASQNYKKFISPAK